MPVAPEIIEQFPRLTLEARRATKLDRGDADYLSFTKGQVRTVRTDQLTELPDVATYIYLSPEYDDVIAVLTPPVDPPLPGLRAPTVATLFAFGAI